MLGIKGISLGLPGIFLALPGISLGFHRTFVTDTEFVPYETFSSDEEEQEEVPGCIHCAFVHARYAEARYVDARS
jgi:hypothetical protein